MGTPPPLSPKIRDLVATDRHDRPPVGALTPADVEALIAVARRGRAFREPVSAPRAIQAVARGVTADVSIPVLERIVGDQAVPTTDRVVAARELGPIATPEAERALVRLAVVSDPRVQQAVLQALGMFAGPATLRELAALEDPNDHAARRQLALTRALIAHRHGLDGPFLPAVRGRIRDPETLEQKTTLTLQLKTEQATAADRERLVGSTYGIQLAELGAGLKCGRVEWTVFFNRDLGPSTIARRLVERPWIVALMARWFAEDKAATIQHLVLTRPEAGSARVDVVRTDGELMYTGQADRDTSGVRFSIADVDRPGTAPTSVTGRLGSKGLELEGVVASAKRINTRATVSVIVR